MGAGEKILLFRHQAASEQGLLRLTEGSQLQDGDLIEVVVAGARGVQVGLKNKTKNPQISGYSGAQQGRRRPPR